MKLFKNIYCLLPLLILVFEIAYYLNSDISYINPVSAKNKDLTNLLSLLQQANIKPYQMNIRDFDNEIEFYVKKSNGYSFPVVFTTQKNILSQVTALQNLIKIANIKGKQIYFIDLSSSRPNATL